MYSFSSWAFIIVTCIYFWLKNKNNKGLFESKIQDNQLITSSDLNVIIYFFIYLFVICSITYSENILVLNETCPDNKMNYVTVLYGCFCGWILIFLVMVGVIFWTSGKKINIVAGFSDVLGCFMVSAEMNKIFSKIMYPTSELKNKINSENDKIYETTAELIMRTTNSYELFINKITPFNFLEWWNKLQPVMKIIDDENKEKLFYQVLLRHNIGECFWYIYTGIFVCSFISFLVLKSNCVNSAKELADQMLDVPTPNNGGPNTTIKDYDGSL